MSFTPGPWARSIDHSEIVGHDGIALDDYRHRPDSEVIANRNLQLAATDMYAALEDAEWGSTTDVADGGYEPGCPVCDGAQSVGHEPGCTLASALAKARGEAS